MLGQAFAEPTLRSSGAATRSISAWLSGFGRRAVCGVAWTRRSLRDAAVVLRVLHPTRRPGNAASGDLFHRLPCPAGATSAAGQCFSRLRA